MFTEIKGVEKMTEGEMLPYGDPELVNEPITANGPFADVTLDTVYPDDGTDEAKAFNQVASEYADTDDGA